MSEAAGPRESERILSLAFREAEPECWQHVMGLPGDPKIVLLAYGVSDRVEISVEAEHAASALAMLRETYRAEDQEWAEKSVLLAPLMEGRPRVVETGVVESTRLRIIWWA